MPGSAENLPTLWDPEDFFSHLALWAGVPALAVAVVVWLLGLYQSAKGWATLAANTPQTVRIAQDRIQGLIGERKRAAASLGFYSIFAVGFAYMLAVIVDGFTQLGESDPNVFLTSKVVEGAVAVTALSPAAVWTVVLSIAGIGLLGIAHIAGADGLLKLLMFLGGLAWFFAWAVGWLLGIGVVFELAGLALGHNMPSPPPPVPLVVTEAVTVILAIMVGMLLPKIGEASKKAFNP